MACRSKAVVRERVLWCWAQFCWAFSHLEFDAGFSFTKWQVLFCSNSQDILLPDADLWLIGNVRIWLMSLYQIVPLCFLHKVHDPKCKITGAHISNIWSSQRRSRILSISAQTPTRILPSSVFLSQVSQDIQGLIVKICVVKQLWEPVSCSSCLHVFLISCSTKICLWLAGLNQSNEAKQAFFS